MAAPDTVIGLAAVFAVQLLITIGGAFHTWLSTRRTTKRSKTIKDDVGEMKTHVVNDHGDRNLRDDIDRLLELGEENHDGLAEMRGEVRQLTHRVDVITGTPPGGGSNPHIVRPRTGW